MTYWKMIFRGCNFVKVYTSLLGIYSVKNQEVEFLQNKWDLAILSNEVKKKDGRRSNDSCL